MDKGPQHLLSGGRVRKVVLGDNGQKAPLVGGLCELPDRAVPGTELNVNKLEMLR